jgi:hypothetical protein
MFLQFLRTKYEINFKNINKKNNLDVNIENINNDNNVNNYTDDNIDVNIELLEDGKIESKKINILNNTSEKNKFKSTLYTIKHGFFEKIQRMMIYYLILNAETLIVSIIGILIIGLITFYLFIKN